MKRNLIASLMGLVLIASAILLMYGNKASMSPSNLLPTADPLMYPTPTFVEIPNSVPGTHVTNFSADPNVIDRGGTITLHWDVSGIDAVSIEQYNGFSFGYKMYYDHRYDNLPPSGSMTIDLTNTQSMDYVPSRTFIYGASFLLRPVTSQGWTDTSLAGTSVVMPCPSKQFFFGRKLDNLCPIAPAQTVEAAYQPFEHGFMVKRGDTGVIYTFYLNPDPLPQTDGPATAFQPNYYAQWVSSSSTPSKGQIEPAPTLTDFEAIVRYSRDALAGMLGEAAAPETDYQATIQETYTNFYLNNLVFLTLPDDRLIHYAEGDSTRWILMEQITTTPAPN